jgi:hypothetical protein
VNEQRGGSGAASLINSDCGSMESTLWCSRSPGQGARLESNLWPDDQPKAQAVCSKLSQSGSKMDIARGVRMSCEGNITMHPLARALNTRGLTIGIDANGHLKRQAAKAETTGILPCSRLLVAKIRTGLTLYLRFQMSV